jgi:hypothetical protein
MNETAASKEPVIDRLEKLFYQLLDTLDRQAQERQLLVREKEELGKLTLLLINQTKEIGQYENGIRKRIQDCIKESANQAVSQTAQFISEKNNQSIAQICQSMKETIDLYRNEKSKFSWKIVVSAIMSGILSSLLVTWILMPKPTLPLTAEEIRYLQQGQMLVQMWPKLTKQEKDRLKAVSFEVLYK